MVAASSSRLSFFLGRSAWSGPCCSPGGCCCRALGARRFCVLPFVSCPSFLPPPPPPFPPCASPTAAMPSSSDSSMSPPAPADAPTVERTLFADQDVLQAETTLHVAADHGLGVSRAAGAEARRGFALRAEIHRLQTPVSSARRSRRFGRLPCLPFPRRPLPRLPPRRPWLSW